MTRLVAAVACVAAMAGVACRRSPAAVPPQPPEVSGTLAVAGLRAPVRVVRDRWGVPHIYASDSRDLFFAQGFVQAQDRLFQMDLWRRSSQGRLSEVLGANFVGRDGVTRAIQYAGSLDAEWASYGADAKVAATAFTAGINAWVGHVRARPPEEFALAGWQPEMWRPEDLLNRSDAFVASSNAEDEVLRARLTAAVGRERADAVLPPAGGVPTIVPSELDLGSVSSLLAGAMRRAGARPFFTGLSGLVPTDGPASTAAAPSGGGSNAWVIAVDRSGTGAPLVAVDPHRALQTPSLRYLVHLHAPGWHVIGAVSPWLPGVAIGHNDHVAWGMTAARVDSQDLYVERLNPANPQQVWLRDRWVDLVTVKEPVAVKGRAKPFDAERQFSPHGLVVATDPERHVAYAVRWSGAEPGGAAELGALSIDQAGSRDELRAALTRWRMPAAEFVYADVLGRTGRQMAALVPRRSGWNGLVPAPGWTGNDEWKDWLNLDQLSHETDTRTGFIVSANESLARRRRLEDALGAAGQQTVASVDVLQRDVLAWTAQQLVPLLAGVHADRAQVEEARRALLAWDRRLTTDSRVAPLYVRWESALRRLLVAQIVPKSLTEEIADRVEVPLVGALLRPAKPWFASDASRGRDRLLMTALEMAVDGPADEPPDASWGSRHTVTFAHVLGVTAAARRRFALGPFPAPGYGDTVQSVSGSTPETRVGASFRMIADLGDWDRSRAINAPGQSEARTSPHFSDLMGLWQRGETIPLAFTDAAVQAQAASVLTLVPR